MFLPSPLHYFLGVGINLILYKQKCLPVLLSFILSECMSVRPSLHWSIRPSLHWSIRPSLRWSVPADVHPSVPAFVHPAVPALVHLSVPALVHPSVPALVYPSVPALVHSSVPALVRPSVTPFDCRPKFVHFAITILFWCGYIILMCLSLQSLYKGQWKVN